MVCLLLPEKCLTGRIWFPCIWPKSRKDGRLGVFHLLPKQAVTEPHAKLVYSRIRIACVKCVCVCACATLTRATQCESNGVSCSVFCFPTWIRKRRAQPST